MPAKLVVTKSRSGNTVVSIESAAGKTLLSSGEFADKRTAAGLIRSLKPILAADVTVDDQTAVVRTPRTASANGTAPVAKTTRARGGKRAAAPKAAAAPKRASKKIAAAGDAPRTTRRRVAKKA